MTIRFILNDSLVRTERHPGTPVLDWLRRERGLVGTKEGCREGDCGACLVLLGGLDGEGCLHYRSATSCLLPLGELDRSHLVTVEGLNRPELSPVQRALVEQGAIQCGFCTPGLVVALTGCLLESAALELGDAIAAVEGNICRCTGYAGIRRAAAELVGRFSTLPRPGEERIRALVRERALPDYFATIPGRLAELGPRQPESRPTSEQLVVAGGTDAYVQRPEALAEADLFLLSSAGLDRIWSDDEHLYLGATTTVEKLRTSPLLAEVAPGLDRSLRLVSSQPIRHRATVGGNIVNASPIGDLTIILLALGAELGLRRNGTRRVLPLPAFFRGYKRLDREPGELVEWARIPLDRRLARFNFEKVSRRSTLDIASVNSAISLRVERGVVADARVSAGGVAPVPLFLARTSSLVRGREISPDTARAAADSAASEIAPISDVRGSAEYKRLLLKRLILAHFQVLFGLEEGLP